MIFGLESRDDYDTMPMGTLPHLRRQNPHENQTGHGGEKSHCVLPEVQERNGYGY